MNKMKLFILRNDFMDGYPIKRYTHQYVIRAMTGWEARKMAECEFRRCSMKELDDQIETALKLGYAHNGLGKYLLIWLDCTCTSCKELVVDGVKGVILSNHYDW